MDIRQSLLSSYQSDKQGASRSISDAKSISDTSRLRDSSVTQVQNLSDFKEGQMIKGEIIDHRYNEVKIQLEPGKQVVTARLASDIPLSIGQNATFQVTEGTSDHLILKYLPNGAAAPEDATVLKALSASSFPSTEANKTIVQELLNNRMPVDVQTLQTLIKLSYANREASPTTLVAMFKNNIPMTKANIAQFEACQNGTNKIIDNINTITENIAELLQESDDSALSLSFVQEELPNRISVNQGQITPDTVNDNPSVPAADKNSANVILNKQDSLNQAVQINGKLIDLLYHNVSSSSTEISDIPLNGLLKPEELAVLGKAISQKAAEGLPLPDNTPTNIVQQIEDGSLSAREAVKLFTSPSLQIDDSTAAVIQKITDQLASLPESQTAISNILTNEQRTALLENMNQFSDHTGIRKLIENGSASLKDVLTWIQHNLTGTAADTAAKLLRSSEYNRLLTEAFRQKWTLTPEKIAKKAPVQELFENLQNDMESISHLAKVSRNAAQTLQINEPIKNLQNNLQFLKDLNEIYTYLQLPVQLKGRQLHSELYVFTRKKALQEKSDQLSVLLHLDMSSLGSLSIHVQMNHRLIQAEFHTDNKESGQLIADNFSLLEEALRKKGYTLHAELADSYEKPDFTKDFIEQNSTDTNIKCYTFDVRT